MENEKFQNLLEKIAATAKCDYLSDLSTSSNFNRTLLAKSLDRLEGYSLEEWTEAVHYITGEHLSFTSVKEAVDFLKSFLLSSGGKQRPL